MRYTSTPELNSIDQVEEEWDQVDEMLQNAISLYCDIRVKKDNGAWYPVFLDLIIRLQIARAFIAGKNS